MATVTGNLQRPGAELHYIDHGGNGRPVLLTHGAGMDHTAFTEQAEALQDAGYRPILWDLRGHGQSTMEPGTQLTVRDATDDIGALLDHLVLENPVLIGHSLGGNLSQRFVHEHPDRVGGLIVIGSTWNAGPLTAAERLGIRLAAPLLRLIPARRLPGLMAEASAVRPEAIARTRKAFERMPKDRFLEVWAITTAAVDPDPSRRTPVALGLIRGERDSTGNIASAMPRWAAAEAVTERVIPGAGHVVMLDAPSEASAALLEILRDWA